MFDDPLRAARRAVEAGEFREAWQQLEGQPAPVQRSPEWLLLAAMARWRLGTYGPSRAAALQARDRYRKLGDVDGEMRAENVAAAGAFALGELRDARTGFEKALAIAERIGDDLMMARCANNLGNVEFYLARNAAALAHYRRANARFDRIGSRHGVVETLINMGIVWRDLDRVVESDDAAERALSGAEQIESQRMVAQALAMRGEARGLLGDIPLGRQQAKRALQIARAHDDPLAEIEAQRILGNLECIAQQYQPTERLMRRAQRLATKIGHPWAMAEVWRDTGTLFMRIEKTDKAAACFGFAAEAFVRIGAKRRASAMRRRIRGI